MKSRGFIFLIGAVFIFPQVYTQDTYIAELMVESNVTLEAATILSILNSTTSLNVLDTTGVTHSVMFLQSETVAECLIIGSDTTCNCSAGYIWSNEVCYNFNCCRELSCTKNVSNITPLCIKKVSVYVNGSVTLSTGLWDTIKTDTLVTAFGGLNGFQSLNVTGQRLGGTLADFEVGFSVKFPTFRLQSILDTLQITLSAYLRVDTTGMVYIEAPESKVCYMADPVLKCTFEEATDLAGWNMSTTNERFSLSNGSVVVLDHACKTTQYLSCVAVTLMKVTSAWAGTYECGFTKGSVRHTTRAQLHVARLPDTIILSINPLTGDCSDKLPSAVINVAVTATIQNTNNIYSVTWSYRGSSNPVLPTSSATNLIYTFTAPISCEQTDLAQTVSVIFENDIQQRKSATVTIPVIYEGAEFCNEEIINGDFWPKTPAGDTAVNNTCPADRIGYKTRTCDGTVWQDVFTYCVSEELYKISNAADSFLQGLGATEDVALDIFDELENSTSFDTESSDSMADVTASVDVLDKMARASKNVLLGEKILPSFVTAASNMLNKTWNPVNTSILHSMSASYLESLEGLVKNIGVNTSGNNSDYYAPNLDLKYCVSTDCKVEVFDAAVNMNKSSGIMKTIAVKNLMDKLRNNFKNTESTSLLVSTTLEDNNGSSVVIEMQFSSTVKEDQVPYCVFWDTKKKDWSDEGCTVKKGSDNATVCECNHLTSFSVLMARGDVSNPALDVITYIGLAVSICSLVLFLLIEFLVWSAVIKTKLSHYRHTAMVNIALFLLLADISFLASSQPEILSESMCLTLTICKHLFFLIKFSWMLCLSVMLVHQLIFVFNPLRKKVFMFFSSIVGYMVPIVIVGSSYVYYKYTNQPYYSPKLCWLVYERLLVGSLHSFLLPIGTILLTNIFSMGVVIVTLLKSSSNDSSKADEKETARNIIKVIIVLTPVFGVTWSIGFCLVIFNPAHPAYPVFNYTFTIVNSFQGLFVLLTGCFAEQKVKDELFRIIKGKKGASDSTKNLTSTMYTKG